MNLSIKKISIFFTTVLVALGPFTVFSQEKIKKIIIDNPDLNKRLLTPPTEKATGEIKLVPPEEILKRKVEEEKKKKGIRCRKKKA